MAGPLRTSFLPQLVAIAIPARVRTHIALLLASGAFQEREATVIGAVLMYLVASLLLSVPYERWRKSVTSD